MCFFLEMPMIWVASACLSRTAFVGKQVYQREHLAVNDVPCIYYHQLFLFVVGSFIYYKNISFIASLFSVAA